MWKVGTLEWTKSGPPPTEGGYYHPLIVSIPCWQLLPFFAYLVRPKNLSSRCYGMITRPRWVNSPSTLSVLLWTWNHGPGLGLWWTASMIPGPPQGGSSKGPCPISLERSMIPCPKKYTHSTFWLLYEEARTVKLQVHLVSDNKRNMPRPHQVQAGIYIWDDYSNGKKTANQLLKACSQLVYAPTLN